ncbi:MAG: hypothetical protein U1F52_07570 [Burkholderiales bacterium]
MQFINKWWLAAACALAVQGCASVDGGSAGREVVGKVEGTYVEMRPGVLVDRRIAPEGSTGAVWVNVLLDAPTEDGRHSMAARLDDSFVLSPGDRVSVRVGRELPTLALGPQPDSIVTAVVDRGDDRYAATAASPMRRVSWTEGTR